MALVFSGLQFSACSDSPSCGDVDYYADQVNQDDRNGDMNKAIDDAGRLEQARDDC